MDTKWSQEAWNASENIYNTILQLPFIKELADGTLPMEKFLHYIRQDNLYLDDYSRVLAHIASRLGNIDDVATFLEFASDGVAMEKSLHAIYAHEGGVVKTPACLFYTSLLKAQAYENVAVEAAAILPCFWIYQKVGEHILSIAKMEGNPYADWIKAYSDPAFDKATRRAIELCDRLADAADEATRRRMTDIYVACSRLEWMFWDSAYRSCKNINMKMTYNTALTIAGSDPSGGAGLQADLKTFSALGVYGASAVVAVVDENTVGVYGVHPIPVNFVQGQIRSVLDDIGADAVKIGMLHDSELIRGVLSTLQEYPDVRRIVLDPVMVATSGDPLLQPEAVATLRDELLPYAKVITPNLPEASLLLGETVDHQDQFEDAARALSRLNDSKVSVMLKAGHLENDTLTDIFYNAETGEFLRLTTPRVDTPNTHGTGCTLSSAIAAYLAKGAGLDTAAQLAKEYIANAIAAGANYRIGRGHGPVHHFHTLWN